MKHVTISVPGKIHVIGEHTVVYGKPALLSAINLRVSVTIKESKQDRIISSKAQKIKSIIETIVKNKFALKKIPSYSLSIQSKIFSGAGLGSSAAVSAAYSAALLEYLHIPWDKKVINDLAFEADKIFNGNPSGGDNTTVVYGGIIQFQKDKKFRTMPASIVRNFVLLNSGKPKESTAEMVKNVANYSVENPKKFKKILIDQEKLTLQMHDVLIKGSDTFLITTIRRAQKNLEDLGVVSKRSQALIQAIEHFGGAAKISGGGGIKGGTGMLVCFAKDSESIINFAKKNNVNYFPVQLAQEGLRREI